ncbi:hypothetical protein DY000_02049188 [Brassica cretica]|uniref:Uncharacterized protein n=1 Tax=Brassica cretica TaxID=69181 RepID=A0ABQ7ERL6_BRACR|nr:hypothetical protein DY000_02049188 [Brassica cretica]
MNGWLGWRAPMNLPMYQTRYMVHAPLTLQLTSAHDNLPLSTIVHKLLQLRSPLFLLNRRPIFALLHFGLIRNKYGRWYRPLVNRYDAPSGSTDSYKHLHLDYPEDHPNPRRRHKQHPAVILAPCSEEVAYGHPTGCYPGASRVVSASVGMLSL